VSVATALDVARVTTRVVDVPSIRPHRFAGHEIKHQSYLLVLVETVDGVLGAGEGISPGGPWWSGEGIESQQAMIEHYLGPRLVEAGTVTLPTVVGVLDAVAHANDFAKAALEMALFDALGRRLGVPVSVLLGGGPARDRIAVRWALGAGSVESSVAEARERIAAGHRSLKLKMGAVTPVEDVARVAEIVDQVGGDVDYLVDPNGTWDLATARWVLPELEALGVSIVEQPVRRDDLAGLAQLTARSNRLRVMADESVCRPADALRAMSPRACDVVAVKVAKAGGLLRARAVGAVVEAAGLALYGGSALESSIGTAASAHLFASLPQLSEGSELVGPLLLTDDLAVEPVLCDDGDLLVPTGPGLGVDVDWDKVREYERR
jgi:muconate/chloromuconate cycloisomerase